MLNAKTGIERQYVQIVYRIHNDKVTDATKLAKKTETNNFSIENLYRSNKQLNIGFILFLDLIFCNKPILIS